MSKKNVGIVLDKEFYSDIRVRKEADILAKNGFNVFVLCYGFKNYDYSKIRSVEVTNIKLNKKVKNILFFSFSKISHLRVSMVKENTSIYSKKFH